MRRQDICSIVSPINYNPHRSIHFCFSVVSSFSFSNKIHRFLVPLLTRGVALPLLLPGPVARLFCRGRLCFTGGLEICCSSFSKISPFLERILMENILIKNTLDSKLQVYFTYSIRIRSRK